MALRTKLLKYLRIVELMQLKTKTVRILKVKQHKVKSDSPEPVGMGDEPDTQVGVYHNDDGVDLIDDDR